MEGGGCFLTVSDFTKKKNGRKKLSIQYIPGIRDQGSGIRDQGTEIRDQGKRTREQGSGNREQETVNLKLKT